jgi:hypothetical protein
MDLKQAPLAIAALALATSALAASPDEFAGFGSGEVQRYGQRYGGEFHDLLDDAHAPTMRRLDYDAIRFSSQPGLGGTGYIVLLGANGHVEVSWFRGHSRSGWRRTRHAGFQISPAEYRTVAYEVDRLVSAGIAEESQARDHSDEIVMCGDGPGYLTERVRGTEVSWYSPSCGGENDEIARYMTSWVFAHLG